MKVKCRGYEGTLISIVTDTEVVGLGYIVPYKYTLKIHIKAGEIVELSSVLENEIEFLKDKEKQNNSVQYYIGDMKLKPINNTENLYGITGNFISYQLVDEEIGNKIIQDTMNRKTKIIL